MDAPALILCRLEPGPRDRLLRSLKALRLGLRPVPTDEERLAETASEAGAGLVVAGADGPADPILRALSRLRKARPEMPLLLVLPDPAAATALKWLREGRADAVVAADDEPGLLSLVLSECRRARSDARAAASDRAAGRARRPSELEEIYDATLENLLTALDLRDVETFGHSQTVAKYTQVLAGLIGLRDEAELDALRRGALLHDIGKIAIPDAILKKPGLLTPAEWEKIRLHPALGYGLIKEIKLVRVVGNIILHHHERYDGTGYPNGLKGDRIPLEARLFAVADALDAITAHRPYRRARDFRTAQKEILRHAGTHFDPRLVEAFLRLKPEKWEKIRFETTSYVPGIEAFSALARRLSD